MADFLGTIKIFGGPYAPKGWKFCNGEILQVAEYPGLFSIIDTLYGGDGKITFHLPNLIGLMPVGAGKMPDGAFDNSNIGAVKHHESISIANNGSFNADVPPLTVTGSIKIRVTNDVANNAGTVNRRFGKQTLDKGSSKLLVYKVNPDFSENKYLHDKTVDFNLETMEFSGPLDDKDKKNIVPDKYTPPFIAMNYIIAVEGEYPQRPI